MRGLDDHGEQRRLAGLPSIEAFDLHGLAASSSVRLGRPGFVTDTFLAGLASDATMPAVELCLVGLWERVDDGYLVRDPELIDLLVHAHAHRHDRAGAAMICIIEGHLGPAGSPTCERCQTPVGPARRDA